MPKIPPKIPRPASKDGRGNFLLEKFFITKAEYERQVERKRIDQEKKESERRKEELLIKKYHMMKSKRDAEELTETYETLRFFTFVYFGADIKSYLRAWSNPFSRYDIISIENKLKANEMESGVQNLYNEIIRESV